MREVRTLRDMYITVGHSLEDRIESGPNIKRYIPAVGHSLEDRIESGPNIER